MEEQREKLSQPPSLRYCGAAATRGFAPGAGAAGAVAVTGAADGALTGSGGAG